MPSAWTFAPAGDPPCPLLVERQLVERDGRVSVQTRVRRGVTKPARDDFVRGFIQLDERLARAMPARASARAQ